MKWEVDVLLKWFYYVKGNELFEFVGLIMKCSNNLSYFDVLIKSIGVSVVYELKKELGK